VLRRCACVALVFGCRLGGAADSVVNHVSLIILVIVTEDPYEGFKVRVSSLSSSVCLRVVCSREFPLNT
jgi:hypothetical protein